MVNNFDKKAKECCIREHDLLVEYLDKCDSNYQNPRDRQRCYRLTVRRSGQRGKKCMTDE